jgi:hypothetical protein
VVAHRSATLSFIWQIDQCCATAKWDESTLPPKDVIDFEQLDFWKLAGIFLSNSCIGGAVKCLATISDLLE